MPTTFDINATYLRLKDIAGTPGAVTFIPPPAEVLTDLTAPTEDGVIVVSVNHVFATPDGNVQLTLEDLGVPPAGGVYTVDNGLTEDVPNNFQLGGTLLHATVIWGQGLYTLTSTSSVPSGQATFQGFNTGTGTGIFGRAVAGEGVLGVSISGTGVYAATDSGVGMIAHSDDNMAGVFNISPASTNTTPITLNLQRQTTGTAANGIGQALSFSSFTNDSTLRETNQIISKWTTAAAASRVSQFEIWGVDNAIMAKKASIAGNGQVTFDTYGIGTHTDTVAYLLAVNATGQVIETAAGGGSGAPIETLDTVTIDLTGDGQLGTELYADLNISANPYNIITTELDGVHVTPMRTLTKAQADTAIAGDLLIPGMNYTITGVHTTLYGGTDIILRADSSNSFELEGHGFFYNPIYNQAISGFGIWNNYNTFVSSGVTGVFNAGEAITNNLGGVGTLLGPIANNTFIITSGTWVGATSVTGNVTGATATIGTITLKSFSIADKVIWGGKVWENVNGLVGAASTILALNAEWSAIAYNITDYNLVIDRIAFDYANNVIVKRQDKSGNVVESTYDDNLVWASKSYTGTPISVFQWGNPYVTSTLKGTSNNKVLNSFAECINYSGNFYNNNLRSRAVVQNNVVFNAHLSNNALETAAEIRSNVFIGSSTYITHNRLAVGSSNATLQPSTINSNTIYAGTINNNTLEITAAINSNTADVGYIYKNFVNSSSTISSNKLQGNANIANNRVFDQSIINSNVLKDYTYIRQNELYQVSRINGNTLNANGGLFGNFISANRQYGGFIDSNTISGSGFNYGISNNVLDKANYQNSPISTETYPSQISSNTLNFGIIQANRLINAEVENLTIGSSHSYYLNDIKNTILDYTGITAGDNLINSTIDRMEIVYNESLTFTGAAGAGAIGQVTLAPMLIPTGYFISQILFDVSTALVGTGAIINLGIATDDTNGALNDTTGDIAILNSQVITSFYTANFTKATANRLVAMEVKTAAITAGAVTFTIKLAKLA